MITMSHKLFRDYIEHFKGISIPSGIIINTKQANGTAFFPGGHGIYKEGEIVKDSYPIMIVGQDFDNEENFRQLIETNHQSEVQNKNRTWINLLSILKEVNISPEDCFYTNIIMGLRKGNENNHTKSVAFKKENEEFLKKNISFFKHQLEVIQPRMIIGLGVQIPRFIGQCFLKYLKGLDKVRSFKDLDNLYKDQDLPYCIPRQHIEYTTQTPLYLAFITHPSFYSLNHKRRVINKDDNRELQIVRKGLEKIF